MRINCLHVLLVVILSMICLDNVMASDLVSDDFARSISGAVVPFIIVGELSLVSDKKEFTTGIKALGATTMTTSFLKRIVGEKRPNSDSTFSFPSGHTTAAFAMATVLSDYRPQYKWPAYITAAAIGYSRVEVGSHYWQDVIGGAAIGYYMAKTFTKEGLAPTSNGIALQWSW
ncbi:phosphatase PAP2 family protein [bacterium]|nr:phosphatase PAP2 family protein [bacterium]